MRLVIRDVYCIHLTLNHSPYRPLEPKDNLTLIFLTVGTKALYALHQNKFSIFLVEWDRLLSAAWKDRDDLRGMGVCSSMLTLQSVGMLFSEAHFRARMANLVMKLGTSFFVLLQGGNGNLEAAHCVLDDSCILGLICPHQHHELILAGSLSLRLFCRSGCEAPLRRWALLET